MVFRKPYAFLIKNFKRIHIGMFLVCLYIFIKLNGIVEFIKEYVSFGTYNSSLEPFSSKAGILFYLAIFLILGISVTLIVLLRRKNKPWKIYLIYIIEHLVVLYATVAVSNFFMTYTVTTTTSGILIYRDVLNIARLFYLAVLFLLGFRFFGFDLKKFNFTKDEEFMELDEEDREEFEININFDRYSIRRKFNLIKRNIKYFYLEHRFFSNIGIAVFTIFLVISMYNFYQTHRSYKQNQTFRAGLYEITIKDSFVTDKDFSGKKIEKGNKFVIVLVKIKNISNRKVLPNLDRYHLMNGTHDKTYNSYYSSYFSDLGVGADVNTEMSPGTTRNFYMVYKVNEKLFNFRFVMYYQELGGKLRSYLRKIKLKLKDVSKIEDAGTYKINEKITFNYASGDKKKITINDYKIAPTFNYNRYYCNSSNSCGINNELVMVGEGNQILYLSFASSDFEGEEFIDFCKRYGKIKYIDSKGKTHYSSIVNAINTNYEGKEIFIKISNEIAGSKNIDICYTLRNKRYTLKIK